MSDLELAHQLTNYRRTFAILGVAFKNAGTSLHDSDDRRAAIATLERELASDPIEMGLDMLAVDAAFMCLVGLLAGKTGMSPQQILEHHFKAAPTDADWRAMVEGARHRREETP